MRRRGPMQKNRTLLIAVPLLILLAGMVLYQYGFLKIGQEIAELKEEKDAKLKVLSGYISLISERSELEQKLKSLKQEREAQGINMIEASSPSIAAVTLQKDVKSIILDSGGSISSERVRKTEEFGPFRVITVSIDAVLPDAGVLGDILYSIETRTPYFVVRELDSRVRSYRRTSTKKGQGKLNLKLDVSALTNGA